MKPTIGTPVLRTRRTFAHCFQSQLTASSPFGPSHQVGLRVHHRQPVAVVVLAGDLVVAEDVAGGRGMTVGPHPVLVGDVVVVAHDAVVAQRRALEEEVVLLPRHAVVHAGTRTSRNRRAGRS